MGMGMRHSFCGKNGCCPELDLDEETRSASIVEDGLVLLWLNESQLDGLADTLRELGYGKKDGT